MSGVGLFESLTMVWVAGFASWLADPAAFMDSSIMLHAAEWIPRIKELTEHQFIIGGSILLTALVLIKNTLRGIAQYATTRYSTAIGSKIGSDLMTQILYRPYIWFLDKKTVDLQLLLNWRQHIGTFLQDILRSLTNIIVITFMLITLFIYDPVVTIPVMGVLTLLSLLLFRILRVHIDYQSQYEKDIRTKAFRSASYTIRAYKDVRIENVEDTFLVQFRLELRRLIKVASWRTLISSIPSLLLEFLGFLALSGMIIILVLTRGMNSGETLSYMAILAVVSWRVIPAVNIVLRTQTKVRSSVPFINSVLDFLDEDIPLDDALSHDTKALKLNRELVLHGVTFKYPAGAEPSIRNLSLSIRRGEKVGIIGDSGSGKTTIIDILAGLLRPDEGYISVDGLEIKDMDLKRWQMAIGYMPQSPFLVPGTLAENVAFGVSETDQDASRIREALNMASLEEDRWDVNELLSETGRNLSGGQAQRMALARMFYKKSDVLLIDEGTSSLDMGTESKILDDLFNESSDKTIILITHRQESLYRCERIISIGSGRIIDDGTPEAVLGKA